MVDSKTPDKQEKVPEGESRWLIERTYAKGQPAERREFWLGTTRGDVHGDSFDHASDGAVWTTNALEAARFSSRRIAEILRLRHFHPEAPVEACEHLFQCGISDPSATLPNAKIDNLISRLKRKLDQPTIHPSENWITLGTEALILLSEVGSSARGELEEKPVAWLIERPKGTGKQQTIEYEVVLSPLTDDTFMDEGDEAWPLYKKPQYVKQK